MTLIAWILAIFSGACDAASRGIIKATKVDKFTLTAASCFLALPIYGIFLAFTGIPDIKAVFWLAVAAHVPLVAWARILTVEAHRESPLILTMPYLSFTPAFLLVTSPLMGGDASTITGGIGVIILTSGLYILNIQTERIGFLEPIKAFLKEKGSRKMFLVALIYAISANLDYIAFKNANAPTYLIVDQFFIGLVMLIFAVWHYSKNVKGGKSVSLSGQWRAIGSYSLMSAASTLYLLAFAWISVVPYIIAAKRAGAILFTVFLGLLMAFVVKHRDFANEKENLKYRLPGVLVMIGGMLIIVLWG